MPKKNPLPLTRGEFDALDRRMSDGSPFTYGELCTLVRASHDDRAVDHRIQLWRKRGWIAYQRQGRDTVWRLTDTFPQHLRSPE